MLVAFVLVAVVAAEPPTPSFTADDLLLNCSIALLRPTDIKEEARPRGAHCLGYLAGIADAHALISALTPAARMWCEPGEGMSAETRARLVVAYLEKNPKRAHEPARIEVIRAMKGAHPCPSTRGTPDPFADVPDLELPPGSRLVPVPPASSTSKEL